MAKYFTLYGWDPNKQETLRIKSDETNFVFTYPKDISKIAKGNLFNESKLYFRTGKSNVYFDKFAKKTSYGMAILSNNIKFNLNYLNKVKHILFGLDLDIERARDIFNKEFKELEEAKPNTKFKSNPDSQVKYNQAQVGSTAARLLRSSRRLKIINDFLSDAKYILSQLPNGSVLRKGEYAFALLIGTEKHFGLDVDVKALDAAGLKEKYLYKTKTSYKITVDDGVKEKRHSKPTQSIESFSQDQLYDYISNYKVYYDEKVGLEGLIKTDEDFLVDALPEGETILNTKLGGKLVITKTMNNPQLRVDKEKVKADPSVWPKYCKPATDSSIFTIKELNLYEN